MHVHDPLAAKESTGISPWYVHVPSTQGKIPGLDTIWVEDYISTPLNYSNAPLHPAPQCSVSQLLAFCEHEDEMHSIFLPHP